MPKTVCAHGHPINRREAKTDLGLHVEEPNKKIEKAMWDLYVAYEDDLKMNDPFDPVAEALAMRGTAPQVGQWFSARLPTLRLAVIESTTTTHVFEQDVRVTATLNPDGNMAANSASVRAAWVTE